MAFNFAMLKKLMVECCRLLNRVFCREETNKKGRVNGKEAKPMNEFKRGMVLWSYEEHGDKEDWDEWEDAELSDLSSMTWNQFQEWLETKQIITIEKVVSGIWKKVSDKGHTFMMRFSRDGTYVEYNIKTENRVEWGKWEISSFSRSIKTTIISQRQGKPITFILEIFGDGKGNYAGVETREDRLYAYFTVNHLRRNRGG